MSHSSFWGFIQPSQGHLQVNLDTWLLPLLLLLLSSLVWILLHLQTRRLYLMTKHIPAPPRLPLLGNALQFLGNTSKTASRMLTYLNDYGDFVPLWLGPGHFAILISHPDDLRVYFTSTKITDRSGVYRFIESALGDGNLFTANGKIWRKNRRLIAPSFHPSVIRNFRSIFYKHSKVLLDVIYKEVGREFDVLPYFKRLTFDTIGETAFDCEFYGQTKGNDLMDIIMQSMEMMCKRLLKPWLHPDIIFNMTNQGKAQSQRVQRARDIVANIIKGNQDRLMKSHERKEKQSGRNAFIYQMLQAGFELDEIFNQICTILVVGLDSSAITLSFVLMMLGSHQDVQDKLYEEVLAVEEGLAGREIEMEDLDMYPYMEMCINETLRLFPLGPISGRTCMEDIKFSKYTIPKGAEVAAVVFKTHRDPRWWPEPLRFDPDRFLPENKEGRHPYSFVAFSAGPRNCIGGKYAMMQMKIVLSRFLLKYKVHCRLTVPEMKLKMGIVLTLKNGFLITIEERKRK